MRCRLALIATTTLSALAPTAPAGAAGFFPAEPIDGPSADIVSVGDLDVARDGSGAVAYVRTDAGVPHVFVSRLVNGVFQTPERLDIGLDGVGAQPAVAAADGGRLAVVFINGGTAFATIRDAGAPGWTAPQPLSAGASSPSVDMSIHGAAYATYTVGGNVLAARLERGATTFTGLDQPLDIDAGRHGAGLNGGRSHVAIGADGTGIAVWGEAGGVYARRLYRNSVSSQPVQLSVDSFEGRPGGTADQPAVAIEDDSSFAYLTFLQQFNDNGSTRVRALARRLRGSQLDDPVAVDALGWGGDSAASVGIEVNGKGAGVATAGTATGGAAAAILKDDTFNPGVGIGGSGVPSMPLGAVAETTARVVGVLSAGDRTVHARYYNDRADTRTVPSPGPDTLVSNPNLGPVDVNAGFDVAGNRTGDFSLVFVQGTGPERRLVAAGYDRDPGAFRTYSSSKWRNPRRAPLSWGTALDLWGPVTYSVLIDGKEVAKTTDTKQALLPGVVRDGLHQWRVVAVDRRGQSVTTPLRPLRLDATAPKVTFSVRRTRRVVTVAAKPADVLPPSGQASGIDYVRIDFGDGSGRVQARRATHRYGRTGSFTIRVSATDKAGNATAATRQIRIGGR